MSSDLLQSCGHSGLVTVGFPFQGFDRVLHRIPARLQRGEVRKELNAIQG